MMEDITNIQIVMVTGLIFILGVLIGVALCLQKFEDYKIEISKLWMTINHLEKAKEAREDG